MKAIRTVIEEKAGTTLLSPVFIIFDSCVYRN